MALDDADWLGSCSIKVSTAVWLDAANDSRAIEPSVADQFEPSVMKHANKSSSSHRSYKAGSEHLNRIQQRSFVIMPVTLILQHTNSVPVYRNFSDSLDFTYQTPHVLALPFPAASTCWTCRSCSHLQSLVNKERHMITIRPSSSNVWWWYRRTCSPDIVWSTVLPGGILSR